MAYTVNVFTLDGCSHCTILKNELKANDIPFTEFEVTKYKKIYDEVMKISKVDALPTVYLQNPETNSGPVLVAGLDFDNKEEAIQRIKRYL